MSHDPRPRLRAGTSGYSYKEWKGSFYPEELPRGEMLAYYAERLPAVEINNTFYRLPSEKLLRGWAEQVPEGFRFVLKASRKITHHGRLKGVEEPLEYLLRSCSALGGKMGPLLFQLPPYLRADPDRLREFLELLPGGVRAAFEFRHASWFDDDTFAALEAAGAALVVADEKEEHLARRATAPWGYLRLRRAAYDDEELADWAAWVGGQRWEEAWVFFKHEDEATGPRLAQRFLDLYPRSR